MISSALLCGLVVATIATVLLTAWRSARSATRALPAPDLRRRPSLPQISDACALLQLTWPASDKEITLAERAALPRAFGDTFADGTLRSEGMAQRLKAAEVLWEANAYDANPPIEAADLLSDWNQRAGLLGRLWASAFPSPAILRLRLHAASETTNPVESRDWLHSNAFS